MNTNFFLPLNLFIQTFVFVYFLCFIHICAFVFRINNAAAITDSIVSIVVMLLILIFRSINWIRSSFFFNANQRAHIDAFIFYIFSLIWAIVIWFREIKSFFHDLINIFMSVTVRKNSEALFWRINWWNSSLNTRFRFGWCCWQFDWLRFYANMQLGCYCCWMYVWIFSAIMMI